MSKRYKGAILSSTPPTTSTSSASGVWTEQQFMQGVASGSWPALAGAPTIGTATAGALSASVTFTAPTYTGSGITGYTVTSSPGGITGTGAYSPVTVSGLTAGTAYTFTVTATTAAGQGPASAASNSVTPTAPNYIEDVYSTYLYTGVGGNSTITNSIDLSSKGGLVWIKDRSNPEAHILNDTNRGANNILQTQATDPSYSVTNFLNSFNTTGFTVGTNCNTSAHTYASWTFRKQPKFFDVVTYTGDGTGLSRQIAHSLESAPGCIIIKRTDAVQNWKVYHRSLGNNFLIELNTNGAATNQGTQVWDSQPTYFSTLSYNVSGTTYVAYLFAHDAGGFGLTGTDNVISCGSFSCSPSGTATVTLGYEPQWILAKDAANAGGWELLDVMRGMSYTATEELIANTSGASYTYNPGVVIPTATGFTVTSSSPFGASSNIIYIAIRRGPMKVPTSGTSVFAPIAYTGTGSALNITGASFPPDLSINQARVVGSGWGAAWYDRLRGPNNFLRSSATSAENTTYTNELTTFNMNGVSLGASTNGVTNNSGQDYVDWLLGRAPSFFDEVCYTGTGSTRTQAHNLGVVPELIITKRRSTATYSWAVYTASQTAGYVLLLNATQATTNYPNAYTTTSPTSSVFSVGTAAETNTSAVTYVSYLFATCPGVSKVGSYTGTGATQTISCGFTGGARFVLVKRTDDVGDWYVWDTARGMVSGTDPSLLLNTTAAEVNANSVYTTSVGFQIVSTAAGINASGGSYIYLAIA